MLNPTVIALALVTIFASVSLAATAVDEYEFTAMDKDLVIEFPAPVSHEECNNYAALQNKVDLTLDAFQYDQDISAAECTHPDHARNVAGLGVENTLNDLGFDG